MKLKKLSLMTLCVGAAVLFNMAHAADISNSSPSSSFPACIPVTSPKNLDNATFWYNQSAEKKALYKEIYLMGDNYVQYWVKENHRSIIQHSAQIYKINQDLNGLKMNSSDNYKQYQLVGTGK